MGPAGVALLTLIAAGCTQALVVRQEVQANPIRKVVGLMQDMQKEIDAEREKEKALFEKFMCICTEYPSELQESSEDYAKDIADLTGKIESEKAEKAQLELELKAHNTEKAEAEKDLSKASELREKEKDEYDESSANAKVAITGLGKAIPALEKGGGELLQADVATPLEAAVESTSLLTDWQKKRVTAFLNGGETAQSGGSGEVVGILKQMKDDMEATLKESEKAEVIAGDGFKQLKAAKDQEIGVAAEAIESKGKRAGELAVSIAQSSDSLEDAQVGKADAEKMLATLKTQCTEKKTEWEERLKLRGEEITAIGEAIAILNDDDALDVFKKAIPSALVQPSNAGLLQTAHDALKHAQVTAGRVSDAAQRRAARQARIQSLLAAGKAAQEPSSLEKIPEDMMVNLKKEQEDDKKKKEYCDGEISKAEGVEKGKQDGLDSLNAAISEITDEIASVKEEIASVEKEIAEIDKSVAKATEQRKKEHEEYADTLSMTDVAIGLLNKAKNRLNKFYNPTLYKEPEPETFFAQVARHNRAPVDMPPLPDLPKYEQKNSGGVIGLMDQLVRDLVADKAEAQHEEKSAQKEYVELMKESGETRSQSEKSLVEKQESIAGLDTRLLEAKESAKAVYMELENAHKLTEQLHKTCDFLLENYGAREEARKSEEGKLKEAKNVLHSLNVGS